jgi:DNA-binding transcriptional LysR family regulator
VKLFNRLSKGVRLTPEGAALLEYVEQSLSLLDAGERKIQSLKDLASGELRIGASGPVIKHLLLPVLDQFRAGHPGIRIRLFQGKTSEIGSRLREGKVDIGLIHMPLPDPDLEVKPLAAIQDCFVVGPAYRELAGQQLAAAEIVSQIPLLFLSRGSSTRDFIEEWITAHGLQAEADIELSSLDMLIECARRGYGAAFVTKSFVHQELMDGDLFELQPIEPIPRRSVGIAVSRDLSLSIIAQRFIELLSASV